MLDLTNFFNFYFLVRIMSESIEPIFTIFFTKRQVFVSI